WCPFCHNVIETAAHILLDCSFARAIWTRIAAQFNSPLIDPSSWSGVTSVRSWWIERSLASSTMGKPRAKATASLILLTLWETWKERNRRIFQHKLLRSSVVCALIKEEAALWIKAGAGIGELVSESTGV
ncbi:hypothetical protein BRADI_1g55775v3, partial [Brachypodium distachyon]